MRLYLPVVILTIMMLFACSSASVKADEKETAPAGTPEVRTGRILVPAAPNKSIITGTVSAYCEISSRLLDISPDMVIYKTTVLVGSSEAVKGSADFMKGKEGQDIELLTKVRPEEGLFGKKIRAVVTYKGDERGGSFWVRNLEIIK